MPNSAAKRSMVIGVLRVLIVIIAICCLGLQFSAIAASAGVASKYADADSIALAVCGCRSADCRLLRVRVGAAVEIADLG